MTNRYNRSRIGYTRGRYYIQRSHVNRQKRNRTSVLLILPVTTIASLVVLLLTNSKFPLKLATAPKPKNTFVTTAVLHPDQIPTPSQTATTSSAPSSAPSPTPDLKGFSPNGPYLYVKDYNNGPWVYMDQSLNVTITLQAPGTLKNPYYVVDVHTSGQIPFTGFAMKDKKDTSTELPYKIARDYKAVLAITGQYASDPKNPKGIIICDGKVYYNKTEAPTMAFMPSGEMKVYETGETTAKKLLAMGVKDSFSFGPILVKDGKACSGLDKAKRLEYSSWRVGFGQMEPRHYIIIVTNRGVYLNDFAQLFVRCGCQVAYNLDGGYSAAIVFMGEQLNKNTDEATHQRKIPDMLMIGLCGAVPDANAPVYGNGLQYNGTEPAPTDGFLKIH